MCGYNRLIGVGWGGHRLHETVPVGLSLSLELLTSGIDGLEESRRN
ncbi:hypothetical protein CCHR01_13951 [Colletotrichum chrysophilum]|uniref:Uncharacterized protein n=1 Tax=Colletotrichum chrysophilum TaxID=1836956 RepID=A0AAD9A961_9PEZI|nr:hypothetical protein CCHR01_13951 [Colletotrichum chrysophilum]